ncbi:GNAT family N-acetyltransferase [Sphingomonas arenae]|uniref:GNAT family N-acetyltransferase n=1 Tax=Sphingomonas arenae TaxID=2812555 RepID=UPI00196864CD|nr:GNAT family N-acetyltransferase [Sphingomonas arenae]
MQPEAATRFVPVAASEPPLEADPQLRARLGALIVEAVPAFYALLPLPSERIAQLQGDLLGVAGTEFESAAALLGDEPLALVTWLPTERLAGAQRSATVALMRHLDRAVVPKFLADAAGYGRGVEPVEGSGLYLSRVAVAPAGRGRGLGRAAVQQVIDAAAGSDVWLHVARDNDPAIALYHSLGFQFHSDAPFASRAMRRAGQTT